MRSEYGQDEPIRGWHYLDLARLEAVTGAAAEEECGLGGEKLARHLRLGLQGGWSL